MKIVLLLISLLVSQPVFAKCVVPPPPAPLTPWQCKDLTAENDDPRAVELVNNGFVMLLCRTASVDAYEKSLAKLLAWVYTVSKSCAPSAPTKE